MKLGRIISKARQENPRFKTKKSLAEAVGVSLEYIRKIESGDSRPSGRILEAIISELDMSEKLEKRCWKLLAERQLDPITRRHVRLDGTTNGIGPLAARFAAEWVQQYYDISEEDCKILREEIVQKLRK